MNSSASLLGPCLIPDKPTNCARYLRAWPEMSPERKAVWNRIIAKYPYLSFAVDFNLPADVDFDIPADTDCSVGDNEVLISPLYFFFGDVHYLEGDIDSFIRFGRSSDGLSYTIPPDADGAFIDFMSTRVLFALQIKDGFMLPIEEFLAWYAVGRLYETWEESLGYDNLNSLNLKDVISDMLTYIEAHYPTIMGKTYTSSEILMLVQKRVSNDICNSLLLELLFRPLLLIYPELTTVDKFFAKLRAYELGYFITYNPDIMRTAVENWLLVHNGTIRLVD